MEILAITSDNLLRDQLKVGLQQYPEFRVTCGESFPGVNTMRQKDYDLVFLELSQNPQDSLVLVQYLRSFDQHTEVVALCDEQMIRDLSPQKQTHGINSFLANPLDVTEFFRLVARISARRTETEPVPR